GGRDAALKYVAHPLPSPPHKGEGVGRWARQDGATNAERHLPHKGEGVGRWTWQDGATNARRHLPPCGGGWEGGGRHKQFHELLLYLRWSNDHRPDTLPLVGRVGEGVGSLARWCRQQRATSAERLTAYPASRGLVAS